MADVALAKAVAGVADAEAGVVATVPVVGAVVVLSNG